MSYPALVHHNQGKSAAYQSQSDFPVFSPTPSRGMRALTWAKPPARRTRSFVERKEKKEHYGVLADRELVELARAGERDAFGELVGRYRSKVGRLALKITKNEVDAQEVVQEAFLNAFSKLDSFQGKAAFSSWLYRVTANGALMLLRSRRRDAYEAWDTMLQRNERITALFAAQEEWSVQADRVFERKEILAVLQKAMGCLAERYRTILLLREIDGLSNQEIAELLGLSIAAVKSRLHRARLALRKVLQPLEE